MKNKAFTLAEILIVLTIIGVLAVMTIPSLLQNANSQHKVAMFKKAFNTITNAYATAFAVTNPPNYSNEGGDGAGGRKLFNAITNQLNVKYYVKREKKDGSWENFTKQFEKPTGDFKIYEYWIVTEDDIAYLVDSEASNLACPDKLEFLDSITSSADADGKTCFLIMVDVDGPFKGSSVYCSDGRNLNQLQVCDRTRFYVTKNGVTAGNSKTFGGRVISNE